MHPEVWRDRLLVAEQRLKAVQERVEAVAVAQTDIRHTMGCSSGQRREYDSVCRRVDTLEQQVRRGLSGAFSEPRLDELHGRIDALATRLLQEARRLDGRFDDLQVSGTPPPPPPARGGGPLGPLTEEEDDGSSDGEASSAGVLGFGPAATRAWAEEGGAAGVASADGAEVALLRGELEDLSERVNTGFSELEGLRDALERWRTNEEVLASLRQHVAAHEGEVLRWRGHEEDFRNEMAEFKTKVNGLEQCLADRLGPECWLEDDVEVGGTGLERELLAELRSFGGGSGERRGGAREAPEALLDIGDPSTDEMEDTPRHGSNRASSEGDGDPAASARRARRALRHLQEVEESVASLQVQISGERSARDLVTRLRARVAAALGGGRRGGEPPVTEPPDGGGLLDVSSACAEGEVSGLGSGGDGGGGPATAPPRMSELQDLRHCVDGLLRGKLMARQLAKCVQWLRVKAADGRGFKQDRPEPLAESLLQAEASLKALRAELRDCLEESMAQLRSLLAALAATESEAELLSGAVGGEGG